MTMCTYLDAHIDTNVKDKELAELIHSANSYQKSIGKGCYVVQQRDQIIKHWFKKDEIISHFSVYYRYNPMYPFDVQLLNLGDTGFNSVFNYFLGFNANVHMSM